MILLFNHFFIPQTPSPLNPNPRISRLRHGFRCLCRPEWGTNAEESVRRGRFGRGSERGVEGEGAREGFGREEKRRWWSDKKDYDFDDDEEEEEDDIGFEFLDEDESFWDKIWIFKVFKSYGYVLPVIIISTVLSTGPKAFLMALAIPLGQSAISFAIDSIWGKKTRDGFKPRSKTRRRPFRRGDNNNNNKSNGYNRRKGSYQSWVSSDQGGVYDESKKSGLGGWDELDREREERVNGNGETVTKLSKRGRRYNEVPMFMRLLVAVFPFLGSWFRIL
ncbi:hypothetical protein LUZ60_009383 [Juncus effusus]|nr:hypothetical protein LUZ60_009383 [Juncus effusus]